MKITPESIRLRNLDPNERNKTVRLKGPGGLFQHKIVFCPYFVLFLFATEPKAVNGSR